MFSSTVRSRSLVSACGITPIMRRAAFGSLATSWPAMRIPRCNGDESRHHADQRRLPCPVRSEQTENFALLHAEGNIVDSGKVAVLFDDMVDLNGGGRRGIVNRLLECCCVSTLRHIGGRRGRTCHV